eukprot:GCRY01003100.1.p1 GENE.GCRY01003100.1~~GCRY01003100.1.p1  ORF type:complete len:492 (-),score=34.08 GCRY01003100.1:284-1759(-)
MEKKIFCNCLNLSFTLSSETQQCVETGLPFKQPVQANINLVAGVRIVHENLVTKTTHGDWELFHCNGCRGLQISKLETKPVTTCEFPAFLAIAVKGRKAVFEKDFIESKPPVLQTEQDGCLQLNEETDVFTYSPLFKIRLPSNLPPDHILRSAESERIFNQLEFEVTSSLKKERQLMQDRIAAYKNHQEALLARYEARSLHHRSILFRLLSQPPKVLTTESSLTGLSLSPAVSPSHDSSPTAMEETKELVTSNPAVSTLTKNIVLNAPDSPARPRPSAGSKRSNLFQQRPPPIAPSAEQETVDIAAPTTRFSALPLRVSVPPKNPAPFSEPLDRDDSSVFLFDSDLDRIRTPSTRLSDDDEDESDSDLPESPFEESGPSPNLLGKSMPISIPAAFARHRQPTPDKSTRPRASKGELTEAHFSYRAPTGPNFFSSEVRANGPVDMVDDVLTPNLEGDNAQANEKENNYAAEALERNRPRSVSHAPMYRPAAI